MQDRYIRAQEIIHKTGLSPSTIWRLEQDGAFPRRRILGPNAVGWLESEVGLWLETRRPAPIFENRDPDKTQGSLK